MSDPKEAWLRRLRWALAALPDPERDDIVAEIRAHLDEREREGGGIADALTQLGPADEYARGFIEARELTGAAASQQPGAMLSAIVRRAHRSIVALGAFLTVVALAGAAFLAVLTALVKIGDPAHAGLWRGQSQFFIGVIDDPATSQELLGNWIYPLAALAVAAAWLAGRGVLVWAVRTLARTT
ncbi:MAG TPA: hypothetical protein VG889_04945 [Rhizomicrobium sp.]|nr:hypothetical protein [Rhizomicrobium sp.]